MSTRPLSSVITFGSTQLLALGSGLLLQVIVARSLLPADYGRFVIANTVLLALTLGLVSAAPKALARLVSIDRSQLRTAWRKVWTFQLPLSCAAALLLAGASGWASSLFADYNMRFALQVAALELVLRAGILEPGWCLLNGAHYHRMQAGLMLLHSVLRVLCVWVSLTGGANLGGCMMASAMAALMSVMIVIPVIAVACRNEILLSPATANSATNAELLRWLRWAPAAEMLNYFVVASNLWLLKLMWRDPVVIGVYAACFMLAQAMMPLGIAVSRGTFATFASLIDQGRVNDVAVLLRTVLRSFLIIASCVISVSFVLGPSIVGVFFGSNYSQVDGLLGMLMAGTVGIASVWLLGDVLNAAGQLHARLITMIGLGLLAVASGLLLIPAFGIMGGAWSLLLTGAVGAFSMCCIVERHVRRMSRMDASSAREGVDGRGVHPTRVEIHGLETRHSLLTDVGRQVPGCVPFRTVIRSSISAVISCLACSSFLHPTHVAGILMGTVSVVAVNLLCLLMLHEWSFVELRSTASAGWERLSPGIRQLPEPRVYDAASSESTEGSGL